MRFWLLKPLNFPTFKVFFNWQTSSSLEIGFILLFNQVIKKTISHI